MILLDTHVLFWAVDDSKHLSRAAASAIRRARRQGGVAVSAISVWELASLLARGKIRRYGTLESSLKLLLEQVIVIPINARDRRIRRAISPRLSRRSSGSHYRWHRPRGRTHSGHAR